MFYTHIIFKNIMCDMFIASQCLTPALMTAIKNSFDLTANTIEYFNDFFSKAQNSIGVRITQLKSDLDSCQNIKVVHNDIVEHSTDYYRDLPSCESFITYKEHLSQLFREFCIEQLYRPFKMLESENFNENSDFLVFETYRIKLAIDDYAPAYSIIDMKGYEYPIHDADILGQLYSEVKVYGSKYATRNFNGINGIYTLLINAFTLKFFPHIALSGVINTYIEYFSNHRAMVLKDQRLNYLIKNGIKTISSVLIRCHHPLITEQIFKRKELYLYHYKRTWDALRKYPDKVNIWARGNQNIFSYMLFIQPQNFNDLNAFGPNLYLLQGVELLDKKSFKTLIKLNKSAFEELMPSNRIVYFTDGLNDWSKPLYLYWLSTKEIQKLNSTVALAVLDKIRYALNLSSEDAHKFKQQMCYLFDVLYEIGLKVWGQHKRKSTKFYYAQSWNELHAVSDYIFYRCPTNNSLINLARINKSSTPKSILRLADEWHREIARKSFIDHYDYEIHLKKTCVDGYEFTPILTSFDLHLEGTVMHHCIYTFDHSIRKKRYVALQVTHANGERASLGMTIKNGKYLFNQCYGKYNSIVSEELKKSVIYYIKSINSK